MPRKFPNFRSKDLIRFYNSNLSKSDQAAVEEYFAKIYLEKLETFESVSDNIFLVLDAFLALTGKYKLILKLVRLILEKYGYDANFELSELIGETVDSFLEWEIWRK